MKIKESFQRNIAVLTISGNMMGGPETTALHEKVKSLIADGAKKQNALGTEPKASFGHLRSRSSGQQGKLACPLDLPSSLAAGRFAPAGSEAFC